MIRPFELSDCRPAATLHADVLDAEFISRFGHRFLTAYYRAWVDAPGGIALAAVDDGRLVGALLGAVDPAAHTAAMVRRSGVRLGAAMAVAALGRPRLAWELLATRVARYVRGVARAVGTAPAPAPDPATRVGEVTHLLVAPAAQGRGVGRALVGAASEAALLAGVDELVLVTPPAQEARRFYERLGWEVAGDVTSRSGEAFVRYRRRLQPEEREYAAATDDVQDGFE